MAKFIELQAYDILTKNLIKKRTININAIVELEEMEKTTSRIYLSTGENFDVSMPLKALINDLKSLHFSV